MINPLFQRLALITGESGLDALDRTRVFVFGLGGVGSWCAEALARSGVGHLVLVDSDAVCVTNVNRQVQATVATVGRAKTEALRERLLAVNPRCDVDARQEVFSARTALSFGMGTEDFVVDAIDSLTFKLDLIQTAGEAGAALFSCMGMAQKMDPTQIRVADIWHTAGCPLARLVRTGLRKRGFSGGFTAVYSPERLPRHDEIAVVCGSGLCLCAKKRVPADTEDAAPTNKEWCSTKKVINGSAVTVTATAGMILASLVMGASLTR
ncbi:MAG: tRNA threonylcarbamoyladenosine dehydratase [Spirochaetaceae bacterium]|jgi:tRNA A37 threonylcarbamoyladenosine dehydratase|nr:tRNA threonylcarbamoyladenosine dehydratase [Spirochaetaceae bacterium]